MKNKYLRPLPFFTACAAFLSQGASTAELPKHKPGLWEIKTDSANQASLGVPLRFCVGEEADTILNWTRSHPRQECGDVNVETEKNRLSLHIECRFKEVTVATDGFFEGAFDSAYKGRINYTVESPQGRRELSITQEARWLGPCEAGQKPGDIIMPNKERLNADEIMKNPKIFDAIKPHQQP
jgi:hypothetical protein